MGTNYYFYEKNNCPTCGRGDEPVHIGKSSAGWCFALHVYPDKNINDLPDWFRIWVNSPEGVIKDEYDRIVAIHKMVGVIVGRVKERCQHHHNDRSLSKYGAGTWDCLTGDFS